MNNYLSMQTHIVCATGNASKGAEVAKLLAPYGFNAELYSAFAPIPEHLDERTQHTLLDRSIFKVRVHAEHLRTFPRLRGSRFIILGDDTAVFIRGLNGEPGMNVRTWPGHYANDEELIGYTLLRMFHLIGDERAAQFKTALSMVCVNEAGHINSLVTFEGDLSGRILEQPSDVRVEGFPFESLFFATEYQMVLHEMVAMDAADKIGSAILNHRERALVSAVPVLQQKLLEETWPPM